MRTVLLSGILLFIIYFFKDCSICSCKKVSCPAFEDVKFENWFPYQQGQQIIFKYQSAYDTINLLPFEKSDAYEASQGCYHSDMGCNQNVSIASQELTANFRKKLSVNYISQTPFGSSVTTKSITLFLKGFNCSANDINDQGLIVAPGIYSSSYATSLTINGSSFNNVQTITRDTTTDISTPVPFKVYLSKGTGLIAYELFPTHQLWVKQ